MSDDWSATPTCSARLVHAERALAAAGSTAPWQEAAELLSYVLDVPIPMLLAQPAKRLRPAEVRRYAHLVQRRVAGEALPRITGRVTFMGLDLALGPADPLIPPDAERRTQIALDWGRHHVPGDLSAAEIGTGCGAIALTLAALEPRFTHIYALDRSSSALETATANGARYLLNLVISWLAGDGLDLVPEPVDLIVCGQLDQSPASDGRNEHVANVVSPRDRRLLRQVPAKLRPGGALVWGLDRAWEAAARVLVDRVIPSAQVWVDPLGGEEVIAVVQLPGHQSGEVTPDAMN